MPLAQISNLIIVSKFWGKDMEIVEMLDAELLKFNSQTGQIRLYLPLFGQIKGYLIGRIK